MNVLVVDSSSWITYFSGKSRALIDTALEEGRVYLSVIVASEIISGISKSTQRKMMIDFFKELPLCNADLDHWIRVGELRFKMARRGLNISTPDAHVAQCCLDLNCYLMSEDKVFSSVVGHTLLKLAV